MKVRFAIGATLLPLLLATLMSCKPERPELTSDGKVLVDFWHGMGGPLGTVLQNMIDEFNRTHPSIKVRGVSMGQYETLQKKILASVVAGEAPDIAQNFETLTLRLAKTGKLVQIDPLLGDEAAALKADIIPVLLANNTFDDNLWSFPFNKSVPVLYYNKDLFRAAGLDPSHPPQTLDELHEYAKKLTRDADGDGRPEVFGYGFSQRNAWLFECRLLQFGGELLAPDNRSVNYDSEAGIKALEFNLKFLRDKTGYCVPGFDHQNDFIAQKVAMIEGSIVSKVFMEKKIKFDFGIAPIPGETKKAVVISGTNINIFNNGSAKRVQAAWEFVKWFTATEQGVTWSLGTTYMPVRKSSLLQPRMVAMFEHSPGMREVYAQLDYATFEPRLQAWYDCRDKLGDILEQAFIEIGDARTYARLATQQMNEVLKSYEE